MGKLKKLVFVILISNSCFSQMADLDKKMFEVINEASKSYKDSLDNLNYLKPLSILIKRKGEFITASRFESTYPQFLDTSYSFLHLFDSLVVNEEKIKISNKSFYKAVDYISIKSKEHQITMLNEAHHIPSDRLFAQSILKPLKDNGYKYLAIETLDSRDTLINKRKYPISTTGFYSREAYFANFIRKALEMGFTLIPYETKDFSSGANGREKGQAQNLINFLDKNPQAKIYVYAGYSHINENNGDNEIKWMAERLKKATNIDPLTINQTTFGSSKKIKENYIFNNDYHKELIGDNSKMFDLFVLKPKSQKDIQKKLGRKKIKIKINQKHLTNRPLIVQCYIYNEYNIEKNKAIPFDQKGIINNADEVNLFIDPNRKYFLCLKDENNNIIVSKILDKQFSKKVCLD